MAVVALCSASGSPGVSTATVALALRWQRPCVLVEADPTGGSPVLAGYLQGQVVPGGGLISLALENRQGRLAQAFAAATMPLARGARLLPGIRSHDQAATVRALWEPLAQYLVELDSTGQDVLVDVGRLGLVGSAEPILATADVKLLMTGTTLPALAACRSWAETLRQREHTGGLGVVTVGEGRPYSNREVSKVLGLPVCAGLPWAPQEARVWSEGVNPPRETGVRARVQGFLASGAEERGGLARGYQSLAGVIEGQVGQHRFETSEVVGDEGQGPVEDERNAQ